MRENDFEFVITEWKLRKLPDLIKRETRIPLQSSSIVCIAGGRQVGKTYRVFQLIKELLSTGFPKDNILYINFEHERLRNLDAVHLEEMMKVFYKINDVNEELPVYLFLDEIQCVRDWDKWVRRVFDEGRYRIYITGSSSKILGKEIPRSLRGRSVDYVIFPFNFREFLRAKNFKIDEEMLFLEKRGALLKMLEEFLTLGSYPKVVLTENKEEKKRILLSYYNAFFYRDLVDAHRISNTPALDAFLKYAIFNMSKYTSVSKTFNYIKTLGIKCGKQTLIEFMEHATNTFFLFPVEILSPSIKTRKQYPKKAYLIDNGIATSLYPELLRSIGRLMENAVARELIKRTFSHHTTEVFYWKEYGKQEGKEVDFVVKEGLRVKQLIQVTYASGFDEIERREIKSLLKGAEVFKKDRPELLVITWDYEGEKEFKGKKVKFIPLWRWLLGI
jgi:predicted AAA+ superfamily ATPase